MWIVGMSLYFYLKKRRGYDLPPRLLIAQLTQRCILLFALGVALVNLPLLFQPSDANYSFILMGTLQRIAIALLIAGIICIVVPRPIGWVAASVLIMAVYMVTMVSVAVPGFGHADMSPEGNAVHFIDRLLLGNHAARSHSLISAFGASVSVLLGAVTARLLDTMRTPSRLFTYLVLLGAFLVLCGVVSSSWVPSVMYIWTPSYCLFMAGVSTILYAALYWIVDVWRIRGGFYPIILLGMHPLAVWTGQWLLETALGSKGLIGPDGRWESLGSLVFQWFSEPFPTPILATLVFNIAIIAFWSGLLYLVPFDKWKARFRSLRMPTAR
jgi:predicted acyltransferase